MGLCCRIMHLCRSWILVGAWGSGLVPLAASALVVYKWTDAQGVVHYSDQPTPGAEKVFTSSAPEHAGILGQTAAGPSSAPTPQKPPTALSSAKVAISSPAPQQTFSGGESVPVALSITPDIKPSWTVAWSLNGTIEATVTDPGTGESKAAEAVTFNVIRPSVLSPQHK